MQGVRDLVKGIFNGELAMVERSCQGMHAWDQQSAGAPSMADEQERLRATGRRKLAEFRARKSLAQAALASKSHSAASQPSNQSTPQLGRSTSLGLPKDHPVYSHQHTSSCPQGLPDLIQAPVSGTLPQHLGFNKTPQPTCKVSFVEDNPSLLSDPVEAIQQGNGGSIQTCASEPAPRSYTKLTSTDNTSCQRCPMCAQKLEPRSPLSPHGLLAHTGSRLSLQHQLLREVLGGTATLSTLPQPTAATNQLTGPPSPDTHAVDQHQSLRGAGLTADPLVDLLLTQVKELMRERGQLQAQVCGLQAQNAAMEELIGYLAEHQASECDEGEDKSETAAGLPFTDQDEEAAAEGMLYVEQAVAVQA